MRLTDTHCHLNHEILQQEWQAVISRANMQGVQRFFVVGFDFASSERALMLADQHPQVYAVVGIHPHAALEWNDQVSEQVMTWSLHPKVVALGEIGLDFYRDWSPQEAQFEAFRAQMRLASLTKLPVVLHCRDAYDPLLDVLSQYPEVTGVLHCFSGSKVQALRGLSLGYALGIGGVVTFKNAETLREIVRETPDEYLLLETDAPYLAPHPHRGKTNEPSYLPLILETLSTVKSTEAERLAERIETHVELRFPRSQS